jgi:hypothetical protein
MVVLGSFRIKAANSTAFIASKTFKSTTSKVVAGQAVSTNIGATVIRPTDVVKISIVVTNFGASTGSISLKDSYLSDTYGFTTPSAGGWYNVGTNEALGGSVTFANGLATGVSPQIEAGKQAEMRYTVTGAQNMPSNKSRLVAFPVTSADVYNGQSNYIFNIGYIMFTPNIDTPTENSVASSFVKKTGDTDLYDMAFMIPGVTVSVGNTTVTSGDTVGLRSMVGTPVNDNSLSCNGNYTNNRGGVCLYNTKATVSVGGSQVASASALLMTVPASAVIGSIKIGSGITVDQSNVSNVLLPGDHIASGVKGSTANQNVSYSIDNGSVTGLNTDLSSSASGNVYLDVNLALVRKNPDFVISKSNFHSIKNIISGANQAFDLTCDGSCDADPVFHLKPLTSGSGILDLSAQNLTNSSASVKNPKKGGYVWFIDGDLAIESDSAIKTLTNVGLGTIYVNGKLTIKNISIEKSSGAALGLIASEDVAWQTNVSGNSNLKSVAVFANHNFIGLTSSGSQSLSLLGAIVARQNVDFSGVSTPDSADSVNLTVSYDSSLAQNPPPGMAKLSPTVSVSDNP